MRKDVHEVHSLQVHLLKVGERDHCHRSLILTRRDLAIISGGKEVLPSPKMLMLLSQIDEGSSFGKEIRVKLVDRCI